ncbi:SDR family NAD(P)-dependent oxidoreductase [Pelagibacterium xiamenense]|uniref:SDR family NAD(P)-dependent oxidoreductase n=1 Tax=Pelagibacterium xiamenense TaxID=2901140 RepID=UPI001E465BCE|nr:SDR family oxidoreductase [Pelagibacterium xiamenense]MCD7060715.1 SDR family oxidoreductase [Pelagibacterium xiamenense]
MSKYATIARGAPLPVRKPAVFPVHAGKTILVTGAAGGLGSAICALLAREGATVIGADRDKAALDARVADWGTDCTALTVDLADETSVARVAETAIELGGMIDGLVNCAGMVRHADPLAVPRADWEIQFAVNLFGAYDMARHLGAHMIEKGVRGAIVNVGSEAGKVGHADSMAYSASKAALISMSRILAEALAPHDINVNCLCPGGMATPMLEEVAHAYSAVTGEGAADIYAQMTNASLGRHTEPREVARIASFLLSDNAMMIRGQAINADAGGTPY